jgi:BolA protein
MSERIEQMRERLSQGLTPQELQIDDESHLHVGHAGAAGGAGHYRVRVVSETFTGQNRLARHRLVYDCLRNLMQAEIHALAIVALTPAEATDDAKN